VVVFSSVRCEVSVFRRQKIELFIMSGRRVSDSSVLVGQHEVRSNVAEMSPGLGHRQ
jgi:hypothetical protein